MALSKQAKTRILKLVENMESLPKSAAEHFDMGAWFKHDGDHDLPINYGQAINRHVMEDCGTTACALGWAATMPYFNKLGLKVRYNGDIGEVCFRSKVHVDYEDIEGSRKPLFGISMSQWMALFAGTNADKTPKQWAKRVRKLVKEWSAA